jgi:glyoxylase-like metal-dependent hydrolase (beta-lactamase superfamily II)
MSGDIRWDLVTVGHLSRNKYWGESVDRSYRPTCCTTTVIRSGAQTVLVDPSLPPEAMARALDERTGLPASAIDTVFVTHRHGDHREGLEAFPDARWCMGADELADWRAGDEPVPDRIEAAPQSLAPGVELLATPGHTSGLTSVAFTSGGARVVISGDGVMTEEFFRHRDVYHNTVDYPAARASLDLIASRADIVVPGHDNYFLVQN